MVRVVLFLVDCTLFPTVDTMRLPYATSVTQTAHYPLSCRTPPRFSSPPTAHAQPPPPSPPDLSSNSPSFHSTSISRISPVASSHNLLTVSLSHLFSISTLYAA